MTHPEDIAAILLSDIGCGYKLTSKPLICFIMEPVGIVLSTTVIP
jgi:hypothetical protein